MVGQVIDKLDKNLTGTAISDEIHEDVGASAFNLDHDTFFGSTDLEIWTGPGKTGTQLTETTDYTLGGEDTRLTSEAGKSVYTQVTVTNGTYQSGTLYFTYKTVGDYVEAEDPNLTWGKLKYLNDIINGGFPIWQRGTSLDASAAYKADRFKLSHNSGGFNATITRDTDVPSNNLSYYSLKFEVTTADTSVAAGDYVIWEHRVEGYNFQKYRGNYGTLSFWVKSPKTGTHCIAFRSSTADRSYVAEYEIYSANTWEFKTIVVQFNYSGGTWDYTNGIGVIISWTLLAGSNFNTTPEAWQTGDYFSTSNQVNVCDTVGNIFKLAQIKFEPGQKATPFMMEDVQEELTRCQRYYEKSFDLDTTPADLNTDTAKPALGHSLNATSLKGGVYFKVNKRNNNYTVTFYSDSGNSGTWDEYDAGWQNNKSVSAQNITEDKFLASMTTSGMTADECHIMRGWWTADAEL